MVPAMSGSFNKRTFTLRTFIRAIRDILGHLDELRDAARGGRIDHAFAEKIMLAVTQVNGCRWCSYGHSKVALAAGVSPAELQALLQQADLGVFPEREAVALTFAQHYAESADQPDPAAVQRLVAYYGPLDARDILAYIRMITFGNLYGNTFDALLSRLRGAPARDSRLLDELAIVLLPVAIVVLPLLVLGGLAAALLRR